MFIAGVLALVLIVVAAVVWGRRVHAGTNSEKRDVLRRLEGEYVALGIGTRYVLPRTGKIIATHDPFTVTFDDFGVRAVPLADIRWIEGPHGERLGGRW